MAWHRQPEVLGRPDSHHAAKYEVLSVMRLPASVIYTYNLEKFGKHIHRSLNSLRRTLQSELKINILLDKI